MIKIRGGFTSVNHLQHEIRLHPVDDVDVMDSRQMPLQARFLSKTFTAVGAQEIAFSAALPFHVPVQIAGQRVAAAFTFWTNEAGRR